MATIIKDSYKGVKDNNNITVYLTDENGKKTYINLNKKEEQNAGNS